MEPFALGDLVRINPKFIEEFNAGKMPWYSREWGYMAEMIRDSTHIDFLVVGIHKESGFPKLWTIKLCNLDTKETLDYSFDDIGRIHSASDSYPFMIKTNCDPNFCSCNGETIHKPMFTSTIPICKICGKEKRQ